MKAPPGPVIMADGPAPIAEHVAETVGTVAAVKKHARRGRTRHQRVLERLLMSLGRPQALYAILILTGAWVAGNELTSKPWDPRPFFQLQGILGFASLVTTTLVLVSQNRQFRESEQRAQLDLQVNLVAERKIAKLIELIEELRRDLPSVKDRVDAAADSMQESVDATAVLTALETTMSHPDDDDDGDHDRP